MSTNEGPITLGDTVQHQRWGGGRVLTIEGTGRRAQALVDFSGEYIWVVLRGAPMSVIHKGQNGG